MFATWQINEGNRQGTKSNEVQQWYYEMMQSTKFVFLNLELLPSEIVKYENARKWNVPIINGKNLPQSFHFRTGADFKTLLYTMTYMFTSEDSLKWYECCYNVSLLDSNFRPTASNDWHNKLYHYDGTLPKLFPIVLIYSLKWYFFS